MKQEIKFNPKEIMIKLAKLQAEIDYIKRNIKLDKNEELDEEMKAWEEASEEDIINWEKQHLKDEIKIWEEASVEDSVDFFEKHNL